MRLFNLFFALGAAIGLAYADSPNVIVTPGLGDNVYAGKDLSITWTASTPGPVTLTLRFGSASSLSKGTEIAKSIKNSGSFSWNVPSDFGSGFYTVEIKDDKNGQINYSPLFSVSGGTGIQGTTLSTPGVTASSTSSASATSSGGFTVSTSKSGASGYEHAVNPFAAVMGVGALIAMV